MANNIARLKATLDANDVIGVAITITQHRNTHTGIAYRDHTEKIRLLHLRFHFDLNDEDPAPDYLYAIPDLEPEDQEVIAGHCRSIARDKPPIWFAIRADVKTRFVIKNGKSGLSDPHEGMNCSTFVTTVFSSSGPELINLNGWQRRQADKPWHEQLIAWLKAKNVPAWYIRKVTKDIGCARVRPEEVAGACLENSLPVAFKECEVNGKVVMQIISKHTNRTSKW